MSGIIERSSGLLMHISSLPNQFGIGTLGKEAFDFVDFLVETKQRFWQILPVGPTGYGNSPYQSYSIFAGNPLFISLDKLLEEGLLRQDELSKAAESSTEKVDYDWVYNYKSILLRMAFLRFKDDFYKWKDEYYKFMGEHSWWLTDYALFRALKTEYKTVSNWSEWEEGLKSRDEHTLAAALLTHDSEVNYIRFEQFMFFRQWFELKNYANERGVLILGDLPLYVSYDSSDVWGNQDLFELDENAQMTQVGGVPPDYFSETGQLWGNPVFNWDKIAERNYDWWMARMHFNLHMFNYVRIDHFRGLESFWSIPAGEKTAINGQWVKAKGFEMLSLLQSQIGNLPIVAEDLGIITPEVDKLRTDFNLPGMKVLQFAYAADEACVHLPHNYTDNFVVYTGTHDNDTTLGWVRHASQEEEENLDFYYQGIKKTQLTKALIQAAWGSVANLAIMPMQDLLELDSKHRMNTPGTATGNWVWRMDTKHLKKQHKAYLLSITKRYNRIPDCLKARD
ncbi:MAG: 4-alpha-glucanotransferase [Mangrovibacterium sp.]